jgi:hypothetical protein
MWLMYGYLQQGRVSAAKRILDGCRTVATSARRHRAARAGTGIRSIPITFRRLVHSDVEPFVLDTDGWRSELVAEDIPLGNLAGARFTRAFVPRHAPAARRNDAAALRESARQVSSARDELERVLAERRESAEQHRRRADVLAKEIAALSQLAAGNSDGAIAELREAAGA